MLNAQNLASHDLSRFFVLDANASERQMSCVNPMVITRVNGSTSINLY